MSLLKRNSIFFQLNIGLFGNAKTSEYASQADTVSSPDSYSPVNWNEFHSDADLKHSTYDS